MYRRVGIRVASPNKSLESEGHQDLNDESSVGNNTSRANSSILNSSIASTSSRLSQRARKQKRREKEPEVHWTDFWPTQNEKQKIQNLKKFNKIL